MKKQQFIELIEGLIIENKTKEAIETMLIVFKDLHKEAYNEVVNYSARFKENSKSKRLRILSAKEIQTEYNNINLSLLETLKYLDTDDLIEKSLNKGLAGRIKNYQKKSFNYIPLLIGVLISLLLLSAFYHYLNYKSDLQITTEFSNVCGIWVQEFPDYPNRYSIGMTWVDDNEINFKGSSFLVDSLIEKKGYWYSLASSYKKNHFRFLYDGHNADKSNDNEIPGFGDIHFGNKSTNGIVMEAAGGYRSQNGDYREVKFTLKRITQELVEKIGYKIPKDDIEYKEFIKYYVKYKRKN